MPVVTAPEVSRHGLIAALKKTVENEFSDAFDRVMWEIPGEAERQLEQLPAMVSEVVYFAAREAIRNAASYGRKGDLLLI